MIKHIHDVDLIDPLRAFLDSAVSEEVEGRNLAHGVVLVEFSNRQKLATPRIIDIMANIVKIHRDYRQVLACVEAKNVERRDSTPIVIHID